MGKKKDDDASKHGGGSVEVHPSIRYRDVVKSKLKAMHAKDKDRWPSTSPLPMSIRKCQPLERVLFLNKFRRAHLNLWKNNHPSYPDFSLGSLPHLVRRIYPVGQAVRKPKDVIPPPSSGTIEPTIVLEIARLCAGKNDRLAKAAKCGINVVFREHMGSFSILK